MKKKLIKEFVNGDDNDSLNESELNKLKQKSSQSDLYDELREFFDGKKLNEIQSLNEEYIGLLKLYYNKKYDGDLDLSSQKINSELEKLFSQKVYYNVNEAKVKEKQFDGKMGYTDLDVIEKKPMMIENDYQGSIKLSTGSQSLFGDGRTFRIYYLVKKLDKEKKNPEKYNLHFARIFDGYKDFKTIKIEKGKQIENQEFVFDQGPVGESIGYRFVLDIDLEWGM